jgi:hypothetical protein
MFSKCAFKFNSYHDIEDDAAVVKPEPGEGGVAAAEVSGVKAEAGEGEEPAVKVGLHTSNPAAP